MSIEREIQEMRNEMRIMFDRLQTEIETVSSKVIPDRKISKDEAAKEIGCSYQTLMKIIDDGYLNLYPQGRLMKLSYKQVIEYKNRKDAVMKI